MRDDASEGRNSWNLKGLALRVAEGEGVDRGVIRSGSRARSAVAARRLFCQVAVRRMGYTGAEVARYLGVSTSSVTRLANSEESPELSPYP